MTDLAEQTPMTREELAFDLKITLGAVLHLYGIDGTSKIVNLVMLAREWRDQRGMEPLPALSQAIRGQKP